LESIIPPYLDDFDDRKIVSVGAMGAPVYFHAHPETWLGLLAGAKAWWIGPATMQQQLFPLAHQPCSYLPNAVTTSALPAQVRFCVQLPGEVLYFGDEQPHATCNLQDFALGAGAQGHTEKWAPLVRAAFHGHLERIRDVFDKIGPERTSIKQDLKAALVKSASSGHAAVIELLISQKATKL